MKLISLNTWGGKNFDPLIKFVKKHKENTDIFCFQEIYDTKSEIKQHKNLARANLLYELKIILPKYKVFYFPIMQGYDEKTNPVNYDLRFGSAIFSRQAIRVTLHKNYFIYKDKGFEKPAKGFSNLSTPLQKIEFNIGDKTFSIFNFHGTSYPAAKKDTRKRLKQSKRVKMIMDKSKGAKILVGDFNLSKHTKSIRMFEGEMKNLIKEFKIKRTRSRLSPFFNKSNFQKFADYTFVTSDVKVKSFEVPDVKISDHLPMILEFTN
ncbi:hypothetical protein A3J13_01255 [Candidatus Daviesbacteria bacterium RIFCSPLOWO2_02_FULL_36_8]|uniref:Endonuclease/exonuclease/phosphatase domain-containing protein n=1 Tax=Candidatus Daviesbacteria bacterium RIFCSPLOWO2_02_FULL_36_8 TaxID=1797793 RepID=A0A1F5MGX7_9BACT|nr:MAG: hypothetical protein A3J13_01255 [Candidatus Daviesbacteria bacterium RIFCSPLOWO2_02_FULL_36_8]